MFIPFGGGMPIRHKSFMSSNDLRKFLVQRTPHSTFYSTAYWKYPNEYKMADKDWLGADLIFDLDGDHLPGISDIDFETMLTNIQIQAFKLWNDFLSPEFGFKEDFLQVTFSGHRGYHLHYRDPALAHLDSEARRELVSHIRGQGLQVSFALEKWNNTDINSWTKRMKDGLDSILLRLDKIRVENTIESKEIAKEMVESMNRSAIMRGEFKTKRSERVIKKLAELVEHPSRRERLLGGNWEALGGRSSDSGFYRDALIDILQSDSEVVLGGMGETDEVVTVDTRRVIRWPTSLHGKCGLKVTELPLERLDIDNSKSFDPLSEAIALSMDKMMTVEVTVEEAVTRIADTSYELSQGDIINLPEAAAAFIVLKGWGNVCTK